MAPTGNPSRHEIDQPQRRGRRNRGEPGDPGGPGEPGDESSPESAASDDATSDMPRFPGTLDPRRGLPIRSEQITFGPPEQFAHSDSQLGDIFRGLPRLILKFIHFGPTQYDSIIDFCHANPSIWAEDTRGLQAVARQLLIQRQDEAAWRVVQRLLLLNGTWANPQSAEEKSENLRSLRARKGSEQWQALLDRQVIRVLTELSRSVKRAPPKQRSAYDFDGDESDGDEGDNGRPSRSAQPAPTQPPSGTRRTSGLTSRTAEPARASHRPRVSSEQIGIEPTPARREHIPYSSQRGGVLKTRRSSLIASEQDTYSLPGGPSLAGPGRIIGPSTAIGDALPAERRQQFENFLNDFIVHKYKDAIKRVFRVGSLIAVFWHENYGSSINSTAAGSPAIQVPGRLGPGYLSHAHNKEIVFSHVRRFVVVIQRQGFSVAIPISTYGGKGLSHRASRISEQERRAHAIIYAMGNPAERLPDEPPFTNDPICVAISAPGETLSRSSRLYYAKPQSIDHNIKIKHLGHVIDDHIPRLLTTYLREQNRGM